MYIMVLVDPLGAEPLVRMVMKLMANWMPAEMMGSSSAPQTGQPPPGNWLNREDG